jgi:phosphatidylglycerol:prolipoprotein diacylglycerol transferase
LYGISRYVIEVYRDDPRGMIGSFSTSQFISMILVPLAVAMLVYLARRQTPEPRRTRQGAA